MAQGRAAPPWLRWIVDALDVSPDEEILELGCGGGTLASLIAGRLGGGRLTAIDRSASSVSRAAARNVGHATAGRVVVRQADLARLDLPFRFDTVIAVNVSALWLGAAHAEWDRVLHHLRPTGRVMLFHRSTSPGRSAKIADLMVAAMTSHGLEATTAFAPSGALCRVTGHRFGA